MIVTLANRNQSELLYDYALTLEFNEKFKKDLIYMKDIFKLDDLYLQFLKTSPNIDMVDTSFDYLEYNTVEKHYKKSNITMRLLKIKQVILNQMEINKNQWI